MSSENGESEAASMAEMVRLLLEDRRKREEETAAEQRRRDEERADELRRRMEEEERRAREADQRVKEMQEQFELMRKLVEGTSKREEPRKPERADTIKLTKLTEQDDIEAYLTVFERMMGAYEVEKSRWAFMLAPQLTGKAQQAYAALSADDAGDYPALKAAILQRYDINEETYRQRFRAAKMGSGESPPALATRLTDLAGKWLKECGTVQEVVDAVVKEQLLRALPDEVRVWVSERKPTTSTAAGRLAEDYLQARRQSMSVNREASRKTERPSEGPVKCHKCGQPGHLARECPRNTRLGYGGAVSGQQPPRQGREGQVLRCYNCHRIGHVAAKCPSRAAMYCESGCRRRRPVARARDHKGDVSRQGVVEGVNVSDILLDTGASTTLVRSDLVPEEKMTAEEISIRCAHGDTVIYPLAEIEIVVGGRSLTVEAAVADKLPVSVLLGRDVPELGVLLQESDQDIGEMQPGEAMVVTTRARKRQQQQEEAVRMEEERRDGAHPKAIERLMTVNQEEDQPREGNLETGAQEADTVETSDGDMLGATFDEELFSGGQERVKLSRSQKRANRETFSQGKEEESTYPCHPLDLTSAEVRRLQQEDESLVEVRKAARGEASSAGAGFFEKEGLVYRRWVPPGRDGEDMAVEQLVLPRQCRGTVMQLAHTIPLAGHMGKTKTGQRVRQRFYWPTLFRDVAEYCRTCAECQKAAPGRRQRAPLIPLPVIEEPFRRMAMDIVGPLPRSRSGNRYVLVMCDYATRYPEAVPLRCIDAEHVAEELVKVFARVGVPQEILTDQGSNFTSQLLREVYNLLKVQAIRTSPYHPQTDGLVERFNQTLKQMLRKAATEEGKDWDKLLPYLLFAYREVPQASTGFSPFELLYGRQVRGPLDVLKETWETDKRSNDSVVSYVLSVQEKLARMSELVRENLAQAQKDQKRWYDRHARQREFQPGEHVLVLLPSSTSKLQARWQGPYPVLRRVGTVTYQIDMFDTRKRRRIFHVNMLRKWHTPNATSFLAEDDDAMDIENEEVVMWRGDEVEDQPVVSKELDTEKHAELQILLGEFSDVLRSTPGRTSMAEHNIETGTANPIRLPPYRLPHAYRETVRKELNEMEESGVIEPSVSEWASPVVLVQKKDGTMRFCVDYRKLNSVSRTDAYPMPRVDDLIDRLGTAKYITTLDLTRGYWQVPMAKGACTRTAFTTPFGLYQFRVMPFGLQGAPATFQRMMDQLIRGMETFAGAYLDDLVIHSSTWEDHLRQIRAVLERLREAGLTAKPRKCQFAMSKCVYLGHVVGNGMVQPEESKVKAVKQFTTPVTKKEVRTFLGMTGYYRKFIEDYATVAAPLTDLTRKNSPNRVKWTPVCEAAFQKLKNCLCSTPVLRSPDFDRTFIVQTDASNRGVGAVLSQVGEDGTDHPIAYYSRKLLPREERYSTIEKECLAIKLAVQTFRVYLLGKPFIIQTDHRSLEWLDRLKENNARLTRWSLSLQPYQFQVHYRAGKANANADALSRGVESPTNATC